MKTYPKYKESGIPWIGQIPEEWNQVSLRYIIEITKGRKPISFVDEPIEEPYVTMDYLRDRKNSCQYPNSTEGLIHINEDEILVLWDGANAGEFLKARQGYLSSTMAVIRVTDKIVLPNYLFLFLKSGEKYSKTLASGTTIPHFNPQYFDINIPIPPLAEQQSIAEYLDKKTRDIDELVGLLNKQIADVRAYRQSLITETVIQGLNKDVPMKNSGVEWIGQIPEGWKVLKFKHTGDVRNGLTYSPNDICDPNEGTLVLRSSNIQGGKLSFDDNVYVRECPKTLLVNQGDIIICSRNGSISLVGKSAIINAPINATFGAFMLRYRTILEPMYALYMVQCAIANYKQLCSTSTVNQLTIDVFGNMSCIIPPLSEQQQIVEFLDAKTKDIDELLSKLEAQVADLLAYKSSLISEVVTGKIDIR